MSVTRTQISNGLDADDKRLFRTVSTAISQLSAAMAEMQEMFPYCSANNDEVDPIADNSFLDELSARFLSELAKLEAMMPVAAHLKNLRSEDAQVKTDALAALNALNVGKDPFENRYK